MSTLPNNPQLPIFTPPCYMCSYFGPRLVTDEHGVPQTIRMCHNQDMHYDFSCLEKLWPFNDLEFHEVIIGPRFLDIKPKDLVEDVQEMLEKNGWKPIRRGWWRKSGFTIS